MRVRLKVSIYANNRFNIAGTVVNLPTDVAVRLIEKGDAVPVAERAVMKGYARAVGRAQT